VQKRSDNTMPLALVDDPRTLIERTLHDNCEAIKGYFAIYGTHIDLLTNDNEFWRMVT
jgi:hypothetical protein